MVSQDEVGIIKVGLLNHPPYSIYNSTNPGINVELVLLFCQFSKLHCEFFRENHSSYGYFENETWHGMIKLIKDEKYDMSFSGFAPNEQRFQVVDFTSPVGIEDVLLVTRKPTVSFNAMSHLMVFNWSVWLSLLLFSIAVGVYVAISKPSLLNYNKIILAIHDSINLFSYITNQGNFSQFRRESTRCLLTFWGLGILILSGVYCV